MDGPRGLWRPCLPRSSVTGVGWTVWLSIVTGTCTRKPSASWAMSRWRTPMGNGMSGIDTCPECRVGKHGNCDGTAWDFATDKPVPCVCWKRGHGMMEQLPLFDDDEARRLRDDGMAKAMRSKPEWVDAGYAVV